MKEKTVNMTVGSPVSLLLRFSVPMLIGNIFQQVYNLADSIIVGQLLGSQALAAVGVTGSITFFFFAICNGIGSGGGIITSHFFGGGDREKVKNCIVNTGYIMFVFPIVVGIIAYILSRPVLLLLGTPEDIIEDATIYTKVSCVGLFFVSIYNYISSMLRALGDSRTPLYFLIFACILNVILDILFVYTFRLGVFGAGAATVLSQFLSGFLCIAYACRTNSYFKFDKKDFVYNRNIVLRVVRLGVPLSLQFSLIAVSCMALQVVVNSFGAIVVAAFTATSRVEQLVHQPYQSLSAALATYCGQNYGAGKKDRLVEGYRKAMLLMAVFTVFMMILIQIFSARIMSVFVNDSQVISIGSKGIKISSLFFLALGLIYIARGILNGVGDAFFALINGFTEVIGRFTLPLLLTMIPFIGVWGLWLSAGIVWFLSGLTAWLRYLYVKKTKMGKTESISDAEIIPVAN